MSSKKECNAKHKPDKRAEMKGFNGDQSKTLEEIKLSIENLQSLPKEVGDLLKSVQFISSDFEKLQMTVLENDSNGCTPEQR